MCVFTPHAHSTHCIALYCNLKNSLKKLRGTSSPPHSCNSSLRYYGNELPNYERSPLLLAIDIEFSIAQLVVDYYVHVLLHSFFSFAFRILTLTLINLQKKKSLEHGTTNYSVPPIPTHNQLQNCRLNEQ